MRQSGTWVLKLRVVATRSTFQDVVENDARGLRLLVERYFHLGFKNQVILDFLKNRHGIPLRPRANVESKSRRIHLK